MNNKKQTTNCLAYIQKKYPCITSLSIRDIVSIALQYGEDDAHKHAAEWYKYELEREKKQKELEATREDYEETIDDEGRVWYHKTHDFHQRDDSRKLKPGDIIQYEAYMPGYEGESHGVMIVDSFDYKSDFACRSYFNFHMDERYKKFEKWEDRGKEKEDPVLGWASDSCPGVHAFSLATEKEIENFFKTIKDKWPDEYDPYFLGDSAFKPDYLKERYSQYIN